MLLRGPQTPGELKGRTERLHPFDSLAAVEETIERLIERGYAERVSRRPGQKEDRFGHLLGGGEATSGSDADVAPAAVDSLEQRVARLEREVAELRARYAASDSA
jgi:uncharacterized protein YceH (UPF0502 family)